MGGNPPSSSGLNPEGTKNESISLHDIKGEVVAGKVEGYNFITGSLNITVQSADTLQNSIQYFLSVAITDGEKLRCVAEKVRVTSAVLQDISDLLQIQARREGISIVEQDKDPDPERVMATEGETEKNDTIHTRGPPPCASWVSTVHPRLKPECFEQLRDLSNRARGYFRLAIAKVKKATNTAKEHISDEILTQKHELSLEEKEELALTSHDIDYMVSRVQWYQTDIQLIFTTIQAVIQDARTRQVKRIMVDYIKEIKHLGALLTRGGRLTATGTEYGTIYPIPNQEPLGPPGNQDARPLLFPDLCRLSSLYAGWLFPGPSNQQRRFSDPVRLLLSSEELFLKVLAQTSERARYSRTLQGDYEAILPHRSGRAQVEHLITVQNKHLQTYHPLLEWVLAGLETYVSIEWGRVAEVILKTQWNFEAEHRPSGKGPVPPPGGGATSPPRMDEGGRGRTGRPLGDRVYCRERDRGGVFDEEGRYTVVQISPRLAAEAPPADTNYFSFAHHREPEVLRHEIVITNHHHGRHHHGGGSGSRRRETQVDDYIVIRHGNGSHRHHSRRRRSISPGSISEHDSLASTEGVDQISRPVSPIYHTSTADSPLPLTGEDGGPGSRFDEAIPPWEAEEIVHGLFEQWEELVDPNGKNREIRERREREISRERSDEGIHRYHHHRQVSGLEMIQQLKIKVEIAAREREMQERRRAENVRGRPRERGFEYEGEILEHQREVHRPRRRDDGERRTYRSRERSRYLERGGIMVREVGGSAEERYL